MANNPSTNRTHLLLEQCSIARASQILGDRWTILVIRELFWRCTRFEQITEHTGIATNILSDRLRKLLKNGIVTKTVVETDGRKFEYSLTQKGEELFPMLMTLLAWGDKWSSGDSGPLIRLHHHRCGKRTKAGHFCSACFSPLIAAELSTSFSPTYARLLPEGTTQRLPFRKQSLN
jgi:DNA-binding HxlR family transcriptional regulator